MNTRANQVLRAQEAIRAGGDTRALKRECRDGNPYALSWLRHRGLTFHKGMILPTKGDN
jgi:hypothetical protein